MAWCWTASPVLCRQLRGSWMMTGRCCWGGRERLFLAVDHVADADALRAIEEKIASGEGGGLPGDDAAGVIEDGGKDAAILDTEGGEVSAAVVVQV